MIYRQVRNKNIYLHLLFKLYLKVFKIFNTEFFFTYLFTYYYLAHLFIDKLTKFKYLKLLLSCNSSYY